MRINVQLAIVFLFATLSLNAMEKHSSEKTTRTTELNNSGGKSESNFRNIFAQEVIPELFSVVEKLLVDITKFDIEQSIPSDQTCNRENAIDTKTKKIKYVIEQLTAHFSRYVLNARDAYPEKKSKLARRMIAAWNTEQYSTLSSLFEQFDRDSAERFEVNLIETEADLKRVLQKILFHCHLILGDVSIILKGPEPNHKPAKEASVSYLLQEAKELAFATPKQFDEFKEILNLQADINCNKLWHTFLPIKYSQKFMIVRKPEGNNDMYTKMIERIGKHTEQTGCNVRLDSLIEEHYQVIDCTLGRPGTWALKLNEQSWWLKAAKTVAVYCSKTFKANIAGLIKKGFETEQFIAKGDTSLDGCFNDLVDIVLDPVLHIMTKKHKMDQKADVLIPLVASELLALSRKVEGSSINTVMAELKEKIEKISERHLRL